MEIYVYICEVFAPSDPDPIISLFDTEEKALIEGVARAVRQMESNGCDDPDNECHECYQNVLDFQRNQDYRRALNEYHQWNNDLENWEDALTINVYRTTLDLTAFTQDGRFHITGEKKSEPEMVMEQDVPCKICGKGVKPSEHSCWWCGVSHPATQ